jgi:hypothetical protein
LRDHAISIPLSMPLSPDVQQRINTWLTPAYDAETQAAIKQLVDTHQDDQLNDAFYRTLEFGTGGLRGVMGAGHGYAGFVQLPENQLPKPRGQSGYRARLAQ